MIFSSWATFKPLFANAVKKWDSRISAALLNLFILLSNKTYNETLNQLDMHIYVEKENIMAFFGGNSSSSHQILFFIINFLVNCFEAIYMLS